MRRIFTYLCHRIGERSTLGDIAVACASAAALPYPWSFICFVALVGKALIPDGKIAG